MNKKVFVSILVSGFLVFWVTGMVTALSSGGCRTGLSTPERTDRACHLSKIGLALFRKIGEPRRSSDAELYIGYAVASLRSGDAETAEEEFRYAYKMGRKSRDKVELKSGFEVPGSLFHAIVRVHIDEVPRNARAMWWAIFEEKDPDLATAIVQSVRPKAEP
ncbi:hypothetical protein ACXYMO_07275 [Arenibacterium sp. CAU 1754]